MNRIDSSVSLRLALLIIPLIVLGGSRHAVGGCVQDDAKPQAAGQNRIGFLVQVPLPLTLSNVSDVKQTLQRVLDKAPAVVDPKSRAVVVLQFDTIRGASGAGSDFYACAALAEYLTSPEMKRVKTVAYVPATRGVAATVEDGPTSKLVGHAVLVALSCEEIALHKSAGMGQAGLDSKDLTTPLKTSYQYLTSQRMTIPEPVTMSMLDPAMTLFQVETAGGMLYVDQETTEQLELDAKAKDTSTLSLAGQLPLFDAEQLASFSINCHVVENRSQLAEEFGLPPTALEGDPTRGTSWNAVQLELPVYVDQQSVDWSLRAMDARLGGKTNLIIVKVSSNAGDVQSCLQMARYLSAFDPDKIRTVAYVEDHVRGPPALIALACDHLVMSAKSRVGGAYEPMIDDEELQSIQPTLEDLAAEKERSWSLFRSVLDWKMELGRWRNQKSGQVRLFSKAELESMSDSKSWISLEPQPMDKGLGGENAERLFVARTLVDDFDQLRTFYQIEETPETLTPTKTDKAIESFARFLAAPGISWMLLFGAMFMISTEMSSPGLSVPGFLGALCLILFFWSQSLDGNVHWLEILLFLAGVLFIIMEIFVLPGVGVFGIGGLLMVAGSIVLASQTFIIPRNSEELAQLPVSLGMVAAACSGVLVALVVLRRVLPNTPYFKRMMLEPPDKSRPDYEDREAVVDWSDMLGKTGVAITQLIPAGKARIAGQLFDVITDGQVIEKGAAIVVREAVGNRIVVALQDASSTG